MSPKKTFSKKAQPPSPSPSPAPKFSLSPSLIARYFYHECERYLRYHATPSTLRKASGVPDIPWDESPVTRAILEGGFTWERKVITQKLGKKALVAKGDAALHERTHGVKETLALLKKVKPGQAVYQPTLQVPEAFLRQYDLSAEQCAFPECRPDLLQVVGEGKERILRVIDIKASSALKASHRMQATLYVLMLETIIAEHDLKLRVDRNQAGIWLHEQDEPEWFDLGASTTMVERFLWEQLPHILKAPVSELAWHLFFRCEWCDFYEPCRQEAETCRSVSLLPYLSVGGRRYLKEASWGGQSLHTLNDLETFLAGPGADRILDACGSLRARGDRLRNGLRALRDAKTVPHGGASLALPVNEHVILLMTLQDDPVTGKTYAAGFRRLKGAKVFETGSHDEIFVAATESDCPRVRKRFLKALFAELQTVHDYNTGRAWGEQQSVQVYVFDSYELTIFNRMLHEALSEPSLAPIALRLLFHFQDTTLAQEDDHPAAEVPFPVIVLTNVIRDHLSLPIPVALRLPEVCAVLPSPGFDYTLDPSDLFWFELSNTLKSDAIFYAWHGNRPEAASWVHDELRSRLIATSAVLGGLRAVLKDTLFAWPPRFLFPDTLHFQHPELSRLAFIARYESFMAALQVRESRTRPRSERSREGICVPLRKAGGDRWTVLAEVDHGVVEEAGDFFSFLLTPDDQEGERAQMSYNDYRNRKAFWAPGKSVVRLARISGVDVNDGTGLATHVHLELKTQKEQTAFSIGDKAVLHPRFTDFTTDWIIERLKTLDEEENSTLLQLLRAPADFAATGSSLGAMAKSAMSVAERQAGFTLSQKAAFQQVLESPLTLVWGPPGTGKTHFLAQTVLSLAKARKQQKRRKQPLRVAIVAFTHAAVENLLLAIHGSMKAYQIQDDLTVYKLKSIATQRGQDLELLKVAEVPEALDEDLLVIGATVYAFRKAQADGEFDLLIVDEASQMKFGELALGLKPLAQDGHIVLAGDDLQLPPIINGAYPEPKDGLPGLHDSIFAYLRARDSQESPYTRQLTENWRMNATLSRFPAQTLYGQDYQPASREIATREVRFRQSRKRVFPKGQQAALDRCKWLLDPAFPLVVGILEGVQATVENRIEADLAAQLSLYLRTNLVQRDRDEIYPEGKSGDRNFWRHGLFIVSPHRAQNRLLRKTLNSMYAWQSPPFVDTVDKMQGQESQCVIVSYGVSDVETALAEAEFIYSLNRLNVSVSRAQAKCVVFLPRPLLEPSFDVLQNEKAVKGLAHMHALIGFCREHGEETEFTVAPQEGPEVRMTAYRARVKP